MTDLYRDSAEAYQALSTHPRDVDELAGRPPFRAAIDLAIMRTRSAIADDIEQRGFPLLASSLRRFAEDQAAPDRGVRFYVLAHPEAVDAISERRAELGWIIREQRQEGDLIRLLIQDPNAPAGAEGKTIEPTFAKNADGSIFVMDYGIPDPGESTIRMPVAGHVGHTLADVLTVDEYKVDGLLTHTKCLDCDEHIKTYQGGRP